MKISIDPSDDEEIHDYSDITSYRHAVHQEVHSLAFHGRGGYSWSEIYSEIPVFLRRFYLRQIEEYLKKEEEEYKKASKGSNSASTISRPNIPRGTVPSSPKR